jgi:hypothetical protein
MGVMHLEAPHQLHHRLSAEELSLFGRAKPLVRQICRDLADAIACLHQGPETRTQPRVVAQALDAANGTGNDLRGGAALVVLALLGGLTAGGFALAAPVQAWGSQVPASLEAAARKLEMARHSLEQGSQATQALTDPGGALPAAPTPPAVSPS